MKLTGRKIGFTNRNIWPQYNINASNKGNLYDTTVFYLSDLSSIVRSEDTNSSLEDLSGISKLEPRLKPENMLHWLQISRADMTDKQVYECINWIIHGFETVKTVFPGGKFTAAAGALLSRLVGRPFPTLVLDSLGMAFRNCMIRLFQDGIIFDEGTSANNVLGSPIQSLGYLCESEEKDESNQSLRERDI